MMDVNELIARLKHASSGSRDLDVRVGAITGRGHHDQPCLGSYSFTSSIDDALSLIPRNHGVTIHRYLDLNGRSWASVFTAYPSGTPYPPGEIERPVEMCAANSPALALCIAALRIRT